VIPDYQQLMRPVLEVACAGEIKLSDAVDKVAAQLGITEEERHQLLPSGRQTFFKNRVGWAKAYLIKAGLLDSTRRAHFVITERGREAISNPATVINNHYLKQFDEFIAFLGQKGGAPTPDPKAGTDSSEAEVTPDEALQNAYQQLNEALAADILSRTRQSSPAFFEQLLIDLLLAMGYGGSGTHKAHVLGRSGDNGVDGVIDQDPLGVDQIYIQAKRYAAGNNVGAGEIRDFFGALNLKKAQKGLFITTANFTPQAVQTSQELSSRIVLINGSQLAKLMLRYNIGSRDEEVLYLKRIDEEFFEG